MGEIRSYDVNGITVGTGPFASLIRATRCPSDAPVQSHGASTHQRGAVMQILQNISSHCAPKFENTSDTP